MSFINKFFLLSLIFNWGLALSQAKPEMSGLPVLKAKQALDNIRFISSDGKFTYYQRRSGDLQISTNYSNELVLEGPKFTEYIVTASENRKKLLITKDTSFHSQMSHHKTKEIFTASFGGHKPELAASGVNPKLHLKDAFMSYYLPKEKEIKIQRFEGKKTLSIKLVNPVNPFYLPQVFMLTPNDVIFSDINSKGHEAFLARSFLDNETKTVFKSTYPGSKIEGCFDEKNLFVGEFDRGNGKTGSRILKIPLYNNKNYQNFEVLYQSQQGDLGNIVCRDNNIFFIKTMAYNQELNLKETEVASLSPASLEVEILSDLDHVTQLVDMDGAVLAPFRGQYHIVRGKADLTNDSIKKDKEQ